MKFLIMFGLTFAFDISAVAAPKMNGEFLPENLDTTPLSEDEVNNLTAYDKADIDALQRAIFENPDSQNGFLEKFNSSGITLDDPINFLKGIIDNLKATLERVQTMGDMIVGQLDAINSRK